MKYNLELSVERKLIQDTMLNGHHYDNFMKHELPEDFIVDMFKGLVVKEAENKHLEQSLAEQKARCDKYEAALKLCLRDKDMDAYKNARQALSEHKALVAECDRYEEALLLVQQHYNTSHWLTTKHERQSKRGMKRKVDNVLKQIKGE